MINFSETEKLNKCDLCGRETTVSLGKVYYFERKPVPFYCYDCYVAERKRAEAIFAEKRKAFGDFCEDWADLGMIGGPKYHIIKYMVKPLYELIFRKKKWFDIDNDDSPHDYYWERIVKKDCPMRCHRGICLVGAVRVDETNKKIIWQDCKHDNCPVWWDVIEGEDADPLETESPYECYDEVYCGGD